MSTVFQENLDISMKFCFAIFFSHGSHRSYPSRRRACFCRRIILKNLKIFFFLLKTFISYLLFWSTKGIKEIIVPTKLEVVWVKVFPKIKNQVNTFIFCSIYSKPNSKTKTLLNDHVVTNYHLLKIKHEAIQFFLL